jgi:argininosuccinate synthase
LAAHRELESICLDRDTLHYKQQVALRYAELTYFGKWFTPLRQGLQEFISSTQQSVTGWVKLKLYKGGVSVLGRHSPYSLYREDLATFGKDDVYDQVEAKGFINLYGLQMKVQAMMDSAQEMKKEPPMPELEEIQRD